MRLNVHAHVLALDGVYVRESEGGALVFHALPAPTRADVTEVARRTAARVECILRARGRSLDPQMQADDPHAFAIDEPGLSNFYAASAQGISVTGERAGKPTLRLVVSEDSNARARDGDGGDEPVAETRLAMRGGPYSSSGIAVAITEGDDELLAVPDAARDRPSTGAFKIKGRPGLLGSNSDVPQGEFVSAVWVRPVLPLRGAQQGGSRALPLPQTSSAVRR